MPCPALVCHPQVVQGKWFCGNTHKHTVPIRSGYFKPLYLHYFEIAFHCTSFLSMLTSFFYLLKSKFLHLPLIHFGANCRTNCTCNCCSGRSGKAETRSTLSRVWVKWDWAREWPTCIITHHLEGTPTIHEVQTTEESR